jgi:hypothetical protein
MPYLTPSERAVLKAEAIRALTGYYRTGLAGFRQKALDRGRELDRELYDTVQADLAPADVATLIERLEQLD